jgi:LytS/YehU family sensor histidine kinase
VFEDFVVSVSNPLLLLSTPADTVTLVFLLLVPVVVIFLFMVFVIYRIRREQQVRQREAELREQTAEMEMKALRAQVNPHFIFNSLQSIHLFIQKHDHEHAGKYLLKFSGLIRLVLENSEHKEIPLAEELKALELYMQLEQLRVRNGFDYHFDITDGLDPEAVYVPPLLLQPFVENSIWHGLHHRASKGAIWLRFGKRADMLEIELKDNGAAAPDNVDPGAQPMNSEKRKSMGTSITRQRLELLNRSRAAQSVIQLEDIRDAEGTYAGKRVFVRIPLIEED